MAYTVESMRTPPPTYAWTRFGEPEYTDWLDESLSWKDACYIGNWSFLWQHRFTGPDVLRLFSDFSVNSFARFALGQSKHVIHTDADGKVIHEGILTRFGEEDFMLHGRGGFWMSHQLARGDYDARVKRDDWFIYQVSGPRSIDVLEKVSGTSQLRDTGFMRVAPVTIAGHQVWALRQGMAGAVGFELQGPMEHGQEIYDLIEEAGQEFGIRPIWFIYQVSGPRSIDVLEKVSGTSQLRDTGFMRVAPVTIAGHQVWALRQGMAGEVGFELQGPMEHGQEIYDLIVEAGQEFGIRRLGWRAAPINHLEACFPTIATDYIPAIFGEDMAEYLAEFTASMPAFAQPAYIAGSYDGREVSEYYRSPVELGWA